MDRRQWLAGAGGAVLSSAVPQPPLLAAETARPSRDRFGVLLYSYAIRVKQEPALADPIRFLELAHAEGFRGVQIPLGTRSTAEGKSLRSHAEKRGMFLEAIITPPRNANDVGRFEAELGAAGNAGVRVVRTVLLGGRRYEVFQAAQDFKAFREQALLSLQLAAPVVDKRKITLAIENHKDFRVAELLDLLRRFSTEFLGVCLDTGNNLALLEDPWQVLDQLAPWTKTVHLKDVAVEPYEDGFLLAEVPLGDGMLDMPRVVSVITKHAPMARFNLEMITRDPLRIPCLTDRYWATLGDTPGSDLARTLRLIKQQGRPSGALTRINRLADVEKTRVEERHNRLCFAFAEKSLFGS